MDIRQTIFNIKMASQEEIVKMFNHLDDLLYKALSVVCYVSPNYICSYFVDIVSTVLAGVSRNRSIFSKADYSDYKHVSNDEIIIKSINIGFSSRCMIFINQLSSNKIDVDALLKSIKDASFLRIIVEEAITNFTYYSEEYLKLSSSLADTHYSITKKGNNSLWLKYSATNSRMQEIENYLGIDRDALYGCFIQVKEIMDSVTKIKHAIIYPYLRSVYSVASAISKDPRKFDTNFQNGILGAMYSIGCFDQKLGKSFGSFLKQWTRQAVIVCIKLDNFIRLPLNIWQTYAYIDKCKKNLPDMYKQQDQDMLPIDLLSKASKIQEKNVRNTMDSIRLTHVYSLEHPIGGEDQNSSTLLDTLADTTDEVNPMIDLVKETINILTKDERRILCLHYGMVDSLPEKEEITPKQLLSETLKQRFLNLN